MPPYLANEKKYTYMEQIPLKSSLYYYKPFSIKPSNQALDFKKGEIDFVVVIGKRTIPIEVKLTHKLSSIDTTLIQQYIKEQRSPYGVVLYGGSPFVDREHRLIFYPYWLI